MNEVCATDRGRVEDGRVGRSGVLVESGLAVSSTVFKTLTLGDERSLQDHPALLWKRDDHPPYSAESWTDGPFT